MLDSWYRYKMENDVSYRDTSPKSWLTSCAVCSLWLLNANYHLDLDKLDHRLWYVQSSLYHLRQSLRNSTDHTLVIEYWSVFSAERTTWAAKSLTSRGWSKANLLLSPCLKSLGLRNLHLFNNSTLQRHLEKHVPRKSPQTSLKPHRSLQAVDIESIRSPEHAILPSLRPALTQIWIPHPCWVHNPRKGHWRRIQRLLQG